MFRPLVQVVDMAQLFHNASRKTHAMSLQAWKSLQDRSPIECGTWFSWSVIGKRPLDPLYMSLGTGALQCERKTGLKLYWTQSTQNRSRPRRTKM